MAGSTHNDTAAADRAPRGVWKLAPIHEIFGIDLRTLALLRVGLALVVLADLVLRARDLRAHYTDFGVLPRDALVDVLHPWAFSLHMLNGTAWYQAGLFVLAALAALSLLVGYRSRLSMFVTWVLLLSLQNRNPQILSGEDNLLLLLVFWGMFLPVGARFAVDAALDPDNDKKPNRYVSVASAALLIQGMSMYFFSALLKSDARWFPDGTAVYYALNLDYFVPTLSIWFRQFEGLMQGLTYYVWALELVGPILIFTPLFLRPVRAALQAAFISMHIGFSLFLLIGLFPWVSIVMNLSFTQGWIWDRLARRLRRPGVDATVIYYDGDCDFCHKVCRIFRTFLILPEVRILPAQSDAHIHEVMERHDSWVVRDADGRDRVCWDAIRAIVQLSPVLFWMAPVIAPQGRGDRLYRFIADNRGRLSRLTARFLPFRPVRVTPSVFAGILAVVFTGLVFVQNLSTVPSLDVRTGPVFRAVRQAFGLYQNWTMFAPHPEITSAWPVVPGILVDGTEVDVYRGTVGLPSYDKPALVSSAYENYRWRKYISIIEDRSYSDDAPDFALNWARYMCRTWNEGAAPARQLSVFQIHFQVEWTNPPGEAKDLATRRVWRHDCLG
ncbi:MAG: DUF393 domain-containing protein [Alphaproteobacteria bacterium]|nr:DUF393 domain-containing protein [Alphaproteobacteria bacterium]